VSATQFNADPYSCHNDRGRDGRTEKKETDEGIAAHREDKPAR
jgi:hypothetical protein